MSPARPSLGFGDELDGLNTAEFAKPKPAPKPSPEAAREAAQAAGFRSRERHEAPAPKEQRRYRTGRNAQINLKAKPETIEMFMKIADANDWPLGVTFERATALLEREYGKK